MNLLAEERLLFVVPAPAWARKKLRALGGIAADKREEAQKELPKLTQYQLTFASATLKEEGVRSKLIREVSAWFEQEYGLPPHKYAAWFRDKFMDQEDIPEDMVEESRVLNPKGEGLERDEAARIYLTTMEIARWASIMVCLRKVETRKVSMWDDSDDTTVPWACVEIPPEWKNFNSFMNVFPPNLFEEAVDLCDDLNPGVWVTKMDDDSKNFGGVSARK